ncbi:hypothetical protein BKA62DRAFT_111649 [Auriculariales sp. MPI-PUGE-AT-0066]|nr:hypothetical protein BKA62DRAFT_111649 [Auriculariales sp. MPI-PUGE-AT-0066]
MTLDENRNKALPSLPDDAVEMDEISRQIDAARTTLSDSNGLDAAEKLCALLRRRFTALGDQSDVDEYLRVQDSLPPVDLASFGPVTTEFRPELSTWEQRWVHWRHWLLACGYRVYPRHEPDWVPSWLGSDDKAPPTYGDRCGPLVTNVLPAFRCEDNLPVCLKLCCEGDNMEIPAHIYFSSEPRRSDPRNMCCPMIDILRTPLVDGKKHCFVVMPMLHNLWPTPPQTTGQVVDCILQLAEGLAFMHDNDFVHRDIRTVNILMDTSSLIPNGWHPWAPGFSHKNGVLAPLPPVQIRSYAKAIVKYYFIDFSLAVPWPKQVKQRTSDSEAPDRTTAAKSGSISYDPFPDDIRMFGTMIQELTRKYRGLDFLRPTLIAMAREAPQMRITAPAMVEAIRAAVDQQPAEHLAAPLRRRLPLRVMGKWLATPFRVAKRAIQRGVDRRKNED